VNLIIGGGVGEHGRNCFYVEDNICYAVDCGIMRGDENPYPKLSDEQIKSIKYLFLTHSHEDHIGAFPHFVERDFCGTVIGTEETLSALPAYPEKLCLPKDKKSLSLGDMSVSIGRSGHCVGSVWYLISTAGGTAFFSGDYSEESAFNVDKIKGVSADIAVLDCAFGNEDYNAEKQLEKICAYVGGKRGVILPVPKNGRAVDLISRLSGCGQRIYADGAQSSFLKEYIGGNWIKPDVSEKIGNLIIFPLSEFKGEGIAFLSDAQLAKKESGAFVKKFLEGGAAVLLTGHTDKGSLAEELLTAGKAEKIPSNAHCNKLKADELSARNSFKKIIYYHCDSTV